MNIFFVFILLIHYGASGQEQLVGAKNMLLQISSLYKEKIQDYSATITWTQDDKIQKGNIRFKNPQKMRIDFSDPKGQIIVTNGYEFFIFIEHMNLLLQQDLISREKERSDDGKLEIKTPEVLSVPVGYDKFVTDYAIEYLASKNTIEHTDGTQVYQFKLIRWKSSQQGFNAINLTIQPNGLIRKVEGFTAAYKKVILEFDDYTINTGLSDLVFEFNPPAHANKVSNFITKQ